MNFRFQNLLGAPYRGGNAVISSNTLLLSAVGNRVAVTDLLKSESSTLPIQSSSNVSRIAVSPNATFLLAIDDRNRCLFINLRRRAVLHHISFKHRVAAVEFSPDGSLIAVGAGKLYFPFELVRTFADFDGKITTLDWSPDSKYLIVGSKDLTARILCLKKLNSSVKKKPFLLLGHRDSVVGSFFGVNSKTNRVCKAYTVTRDCYLFSWGFTSDNSGEGEGSEPPSPGTPDRDVEGNLEVIKNDGVKKRKKIDVEDGDEGYLSRGKWELLRKDGFMQGSAKVTACDYHRGLDMVVVVLKFCG
ncbi:unnamed protein product [Sphenostylis stenocarpa]|uniref:Uncharacterized protein n=1 Tax=Sphenostylis stenocarpa TaxID=92480 RepID=A0AA86SNE4_9FABA|nr:unnamed protein product [Sphenostylis stenocarpa]